MKIGKSEVIVVLDRSGSMAGIASDMEGGFKTFLEKQKKDAGECLVTIYQFDDKFETVMEGVDIKNVSGLTLHARGGTALNDAVGRTINLVGKRLAKTSEAERPESVIIMVITDGGENSSREYTAQQVAEMTKHQQEKYNWKFLYIGANQDAQAVGSTIGVAAVNSLSYSTSAKGIGNTWNIAASGVSCMRAAAESTYFFSEQDRSSAMEQ